MCEPLRGKRLKLGVEGDFYESDVVSAVKGLIKFHEERIEVAIEVMTGEPWHPTMNGVFNFIEYEYEAINAIELWLEDVL